MSCKRSTLRRLLPGRTWWKVICLMVCGGAAFALDPSYDSIVVEGWDGHFTDGLIRDGEYSYSGITVNGYKRYYHVSGSGMNFYYATGMSGWRLIKSGLTECADQNGPQPVPSEGPLAGDWIRNVTQWGQPWPVYGDPLFGTFGDLVDFGEEPAAGGGTTTNFWTEGAVASATNSLEGMLAALLHETQAGNLTTAEMLYNIMQALSEEEQEVGSTSTLDQMLATLQAMHAGNQTEGGTNQVDVMVNIQGAVEEVSGWMHGVDSNGVQVSIADAMISNKEANEQFWQRHNEATDAIKERLMGTDYEGNEVGLGDLMMDTRQGVQEVWTRLEGTEEGGEKVPIGQGLLDTRDGVIRMGGALFVDDGGEEKSAGQLLKDTRDGVIRIGQGGVQENVAEVAHRGLVVEEGGVEKGAADVLAEVRDLMRIEGGVGQGGAVSFAEMLVGTTGGQVQESAGGLLAMIHDELEILQTRAESWDTESGSLRVTVVNDTSEGPDVNVTLGLGDGTNVVFEQADFVGDVVLNDALFTNETYFTYPDEVTISDPVEIDQDVDNPIYTRDLHARTAVENVGGKVDQVKEFLEDPEGYDPENQVQTYDTNRLASTFGEWRDKLVGLVPVEAPTATASGGAPFNVDLNQMPNSPIGGQVVGKIDLGWADVDSSMMSTMEEVRLAVRGLAGALFFFRFLISFIRALKGVF